MPTNWTPVYGTGCTVGLFGLAFSIDFKVSGPYDFEIASYSGRLVYVEVRLPGGTRAQPSFSPTSFM